MNPVKPKLPLILLCAFVIFLYTDCTNSSANMALKASVASALSPNPTPTVTPGAEPSNIKIPPGDAAAILAKQEVPILC
jgi:hypothetical protein